MKVIILGSFSDIGRALIKFLQEDGHRVYGWHRGEELLIPMEPAWDLIICAIGALGSIGKWEDADDVQWCDAMESNLLLPLRLIRQLWKHRNANAQVCMLAGSNPNTIELGYSAYNVAKMALLKAVEHLNVETDVKWYALAPGIVLTKIHKPTIDTRWINERLSEAMNVGGTPMAKIYECLRWCMEAQKATIGGRNICVSDDYRSQRFSADTWKLRRHEDF